VSPIVRVAVARRDAVEPPHDGVVLREVRHVVEVHHVVDADEIDARRLQHRTEHVSPDPTEAVEAHPDDLVVAHVVIRGEI